MQHEDGDWLNVLLTANWLCHKGSVQMKLRSKGWLLAFMQQLISCILVFFVLVTELMYTSGLAGIRWARLDCADCLRLNNWSTFQRAEMRLVTEPVSHWLACKIKKMSKEHPQANNCVRFIAVLPTNWQGNRSNEQSKLIETNWN